MENFNGFQFFYFHVGDNDDCMIWEYDASYAARIATQVYILHNPPLWSTLYFLYQFTGNFVVFFLLLLLLHLAY